MSKEVILTGLRANNDLHIGNYLGALLPMVDMAKNKAGEYQVNLFVPDLHSFTTPIDHSKLLEATMNNLRVYAAAGLPLDNPDVHIYRQSYVPAHSELTWILDCFTGMGEMSRMTQFKDKSTSYRAREQELQKIVTKAVSQIRGLDVTAEPRLGPQSPDMVLKDDNGRSYSVEFKSMKDEGPTVGLFNYPVLMAADILLYGSSYVPVGDDQSQHLEFARDISERMNKKFGTELFNVPKPVKEQHAFFGKDQGLRIKDLTDPAKKMSKSDETGKGVIFLTDAPEVARKKVMGATTDSVGVVHFDKEKQPGISNLLELHALLEGETLEAVTAHHEGDTNYGDLKKEVADQVAEFLTDFQTKLAAVDDATLLAKLESSEKLMNKQANVTLLKVQKAVGLR